MDAGFRSLVLIVIVNMCVIPDVQAREIDFAVIRTRVIRELARTATDDAQVATILSRMRPDGSFADINYEDLSRTAGFPHRRHTADLVYLAKAYGDKRL